MSREHQNNNDFHVRGGGAIIRRLAAGPMSDYSGSRTGICTILRDTKVIEVFHRSPVGYEQVKVTVGLMPIAHEASCQLRCNLRQSSGF